MRRRYRWDPTLARLVEVEITRREFGALIMPDLPAYVSPVSGKLVDGRRARREDLARTHSRPYEGREQEAKEIARKQAYAEQRMEHRLDETVHRTLSEMPERIRRTLRGN